MQLEFILGGIACAALMWYFHRKHRDETRARRGAMLDQARPLLEAPELTQHDVDFPVLEGRYRGHWVRIEPLEDHVAFRKVPSLWLLVTVRWDLPYKGVFDFVVRPDNMEYYSPVSRLDHSLPIPPDWPQHAWLRSDDPERMPPLARVAPHMSYFEDQRSKELVITSRGVRLVYMANQARRPHYLVLRGVTFDDLAVPRERIVDLLERATALCQDLNEERSHASMAT